MNLNEMIKTDCRFFRGDIPCKQHKNYGVKCSDSEGNDCQYYEQYDSRILIIKLGAIGDVIRTTPLYTRLKKEHPKAKFYWLTLTPAVIPASVDEVLKPTFENFLYLQNVTFDVAINLDKDKEACALLANIKAAKKFGYTLRDGIISPENELAKHKYLTGIFDDLNKANSKNYLEEIFEICALDFQGEKYFLNNFEEYADSWNLDKSKKIIGFNTGCGGRWTSRLWPDEYWITLAKELMAEGYQVLFLGGEQEDEKNKRFAEASGGLYLGYFNLEKFINLVDQCDLVVTAVTMAMHITLALKKKIVLFNNIFNPKEFELYGLGEIIQPPKECKCFFRGKCVNDEYKCMELIEPSVVKSTVTKLLNS